MSDANGKAKEALEQVQTSLQKTAEDLRKAHPDVEKQANALKEKLQAAVTTTVNVSTNWKLPLLHSLLYIYVPNYISSTLHTTVYLF